MHKYSYYFLWVITISMVFITFFYLDDIANWLYEDDITVDSYVNWNTTKAFRQTWAIITFILMWLLTAYSWMLLKYDVGVFRIILTLTAVVGLLLVIAVSFFLMMTHRVF